MALGVCTAPPIPGFIALLLLLFGEPLGLWNAPSFETTFLLVLGGIAVGYGTATYYLLIFKSDASESERQFWVTSLMRWFPITGPIFWYRVIWKQMPVSVAAKRA